MSKQYFYQAHSQATINPELNAMAELGWTVHTILRPSRGDTIEVLYERNRRKPKATAQGMVVQ